MNRPSSKPVRPPSGGRALRIGAIVALAFVVMLTLSLAAPRVQAVDPAIDVSGCYSNIAPTPGFENDKACDGNGLASQWITSGGHPVYFVMNLTQGAFTVSAVAIEVGNYHSAGTIDVWTGTEWFTKANFTDPANNSNVTTTLDDPYTTTMLRLYWPLGGTGDLIGAAEITPFGIAFVPPPIPPTVETFCDAIPGGLNLLLTLIGAAVLLAFLGAFLFVAKDGDIPITGIISAVIGAMVLLLVLAALIPNFAGC